MMAFLTEAAISGELRVPDAGALLKASRNPKYIAHFAEHCPGGKFRQQPSAQLPIEQIEAEFAGELLLEDEEQGEP
jgi:hypothetical protein